MNQSLTALRAALIAEAALPALAAVRTAPVTVTCHQGRAWLRWDGDQPHLLTCLLGVPGVVFYQPHGHDWHRLGSRVPDANVPLPGEVLTLDHVLLPGAMPVELPPRAWSAARMTITIRPSTDLRPTTGLLTEVASLAAWIETGTSASFRRVRAAWQGERVLLLGSVPALPGQRLWGEELLLPVGRRAEPDWPASALRQALGLADDEIGVLTETGSEAVPRSALQPLSRASLRVLLGERDRFSTLGTSSQK